MIKVSDLPNTIILSEFSTVFEDEEVELKRVQTPTYAQVDSEDEAQLEEDQKEIDKDRFRTNGLYLIETVWVSRLLPFLQDYLTKTDLRAKCLCVSQIREIMGGNFKRKYCRDHSKLEYNQLMKLYIDYDPTLPFSFRIHRNDYIGILVISKYHNFCSYIFRDYNCDLVITGCRLTYLQYVNWKFSQQISKYSSIQDATEEMKKQSRKFFAEKLGVNVALISFCEDLIRYVAEDLNIKIVKSMNAEKTYASRWEDRPDCVKTRLYGVVRRILWGCVGFSLTIIDFLTKRVSYQMDQKFGEPKWACYPYNFRNPDIPEEEKGFDEIEEARKVLRLVFNHRRFIYFPISS